MKVLVEELGHDVKAAGGGVAVKEHGQPHAHQENIAHHIQEGIPHQGDKAREQLLQHPQEHRQQQGGIHRLGPKLPADKQKAQQQQRHVQDHGDGGNGQGDHRPQHHGQAGHAAYRHLTGDQEKVYRRCHDGRGHCNGQPFHGCCPRLFHLHDSSSLCLRPGGHPFLIVVLIPDTAGA